MATSLPAFWSLSSMTSLRAFLFSRLKVRPVALGRVEGPDWAGWCQLLGADWPECVSLSPFVLLMLHLLFTFVLLYIGL